ncbi:MAG: protein-export chaperone SecB [Holosporales bacterium]|jgi:preprotein translocase subunit SecB|nr:protein-export chaperone SecB [Holosporales bacterium]
MSKERESQIKGETSSEPSMVIIAQFIKDFSFENPNPTALMSGESTVQPNINVNFKVDVKSVSKDVYEISLSTTINAKQESKQMFLLDLCYAGLFSLTNMNQEMLDMVSNVECPRMLFPFLRSIVANATADGGFAPLYLSPVNFLEFYNQQIQSK